MGRPLKNHRPDLNGVLVVDKPVGPSSARVCAMVRRLTGGAKVGHAGTLDPLASGVLVCCLGSATKRIPELMAGEKVYEAEIDLSAFTETDDLEGAREEVAIGQAPSRDEVERACAGFVGRIMQAPPRFSAVKIGGERAYRMARAGDRVEPAARPVLVRGVEVAEYDWPRLSLGIVCGKGVYIRSLARDLGRALGTGGHLTALRRTRVGTYREENAIVVDDRTTGAQIEQAIVERGHV